MSEQKGLYNKYMVIKVVDDTIVENCFILKPDSDPAAVKALQAYAAATDNKVLSADLYAWVGKPMQKPLTLREFRVMINAHEETITYCEAKNDPQTYAHICYDGKVIDGHAETVTDSQFVYAHYGRLWRAWASRPTDEERAAAPWEE